MDGLFFRQQVDIDVDGPRKPKIVVGPGGREQHEVGGAVFVGIEIEPVGVAVVPDVVQDDEDAPSVEELAHLELGFFHRLHLLRGFVEGAVAGIVAQVRRFGTEGARLESDLMAQFLQAVEVHGKLELGQKLLHIELLAQIDPADVLERRPELRPQHHHGDDGGFTDSSHAPQRDPMRPTPVQRLAPIEGRRVSRPLGWIWWGAGAFDDDLG
mmetsp:Transcript_18479/g.36802  ORF Transcript_18479/g.36802 Transcript_18479/m.36802 type:complete len:212 (+) Transcript_18479:1922-2557(+)